MNNGKRYLNDVELASQSGLKLSFLRADRQRDRKIGFIKIGRSVYYDSFTVFDQIKERFGIGGKRFSPGVSVKPANQRKLRNARG